MSEAREAATEGLQQAALRATSRLRASGLLNLGMIARLRGEYVVALKHFANAKTSPGVSAATMAWRRRWAIARTLVAMGRAVEAEELFKAAIAVNERIGRRESQAVTLMSLARVARSREDLDAALRYYTEALEIFRAVKDPAQEAMALYRLACLQADARRFEEALALDHEALPLVAERNRSFKAQILAHIGLANMGLGWVVRAETAYREAHAIAVDLDDAPLRAIAAQNLGTSFMLQKRDPEAAQPSERRPLSGRHWATRRSTSAQGSENRPCCSIAGLRRCRRPRTGCPTSSSSRRPPGRWRHSTLT